MDTTWNQIEVCGNNACTITTLICSTGNIRVFVRVDVSKAKNYKANDVLSVNDIIEI